MSSKLVLVLNCGSSSLKFAIIDPANGDEYLSGLAECFHLPEARIKWKLEGAKQEAALGAGAAHSEALNFMVKTILAQKPELSAQIVAIGHRIVHGGEKLTQSVVIDESVIQGIKDASSFAPLHNPAHLIGIDEALKNFPHLSDKNVAVFDTAFHQTMPEESYLYALPYKLYKEHGVRRYGAHGTSHFYVTQEAAKVLNKPLTKESGLLGLTEVTSDCRYVEDNYDTKADAKRAMDVYCHRLAKYIGSYAALMDGRLDAVIFTGGIGENAAMVRELSLAKLGLLGFEVDHERNLAARFGKSGFINKEGTRPALVIPTNEELVIAQDADRLTA